MTLSPRRWLPLTALCALAAALRFFRIDAQSLWYDEGVSAYQLSRSFADIARAAAQDTHPPLYYWMLKAWGEPLGGSELALRSLSAVFGILIVALVWLIGRELFPSDPVAAVVAALFAACAPLAVYYGQEVRMWSQVTALGLLAGWLYLRRLWWLYGLAAAATLYSQYLGIALLVAVNAHAVLSWRTLDRRGWLLGNLLAALICAPWLPVFLEQSGQRGLNVSPRTPGGIVLDTLAAYGGGLARGDPAPAAGGLLIGLALVGLALAGRERWRSAGFAVLLWLVPLMAVAGLGLRSGLFELRYLLLSVPGLALLAGLGVARLAQIGRPLAVVAGVATLLVIAPFALALNRQYFDPALARDDYRAVAQTIAGQAQAGDAVVLSAPNQSDVFGYYYHGALPVYSLPAQRPVDPLDAHRRLESIREQHRRVWLVSWAMNEADPGGVLNEWLERNTFPASHAWYGTVQLSLLALARTDGEVIQASQQLDNDVQLQQIRLSSRSARPGDTVQLTLDWQAPPSPMARRWKVFTQVLDTQQRVVAQRDSEPANGARPTTTWQPGESIQDNYGLLLPADLPPGAYTLIIGMYDGDTRARFEDGSDHLEVARVDVAT